MITDKEKILKAWERCDECHKHPVGMSDAYIECEYTMWIYCRQDELIRETVDLLKNTPDIVRCKDCKYYSWHTDSCDHIGGIVSKDFFCADGERKK